MGRRDLIRFQSVHLEGNPKEVAERFRDWAHRAFREVQGRAQKRRLEPEAAEDLIGRIGREPSWVSIEKGDYDPYTPWWRVAKGRDPTTVFLGGFHRLGDTVRLGAVIARFQGQGRGNYYIETYSLLTRGDRWTGGPPPGYPDLLVRAIACPGVAPLMEKLDRRRRNLEELGAVLPLHLAKPLASVVKGEVQLEKLQVWDGVALYREGNTRFLVFDGEAHRLEQESWKIVQRVFRQGNLDPIERARLALTAARLGEWAD